MTLSRDPAIVAYANLLNRVRLGRNLKQRELGELVGVSQVMVGYWTRGAHLPTLEMGQRLADALTEPRLISDLVAARVRRCPCGRSFDRGSTRQLYCSWRCQVAANQPGGRKVDLRQEAIDAMCAGCEPEGLCRESSCALRPFSPLLLQVIRQRTSAREVA